MRWMKRSAWVVGLATWCLVVAAGHACMLASTPPRVASHASGSACPSQSAKPVAPVVCQMIGAQQTLRSESNPRASVTISIHPSAVDVVRPTPRFSSVSPSEILTPSLSDVHLRHRVLRL